MRSTLSQDMFPLSEEMLALQEIVITLFSNRSSDDFGRFRITSI